MTSVHYVWFTFLELWLELWNAGCCPDEGPQNPPLLIQVMVFDPENHLILGDFETPFGSKKHGQHLASLRTARVPRPCADRSIQRQC